MATKKPEQQINPHMGTLVEVPLELGARIDAVGQLATKVFANEAAFEQQISTSRPATSRIVQEVYGYMQSSLLSDLRGDALNKAGLGKLFPTQSDLANARVTLQDEYDKLHDIQIAPIEQKWASRLSLAPEQSQAFNQERDIEIAEAKDRSPRFRFLSEAIWEARKREKEIGGLIDKAIAVTGISEEPGRSEISPSEAITERDEARTKFFSDRKITDMNLRNRLNNLWDTVAEDVSKGDFPTDPAEIMALQLIFSHIGKAVSYTRLGRELYGRKFDGPSNKIRELLAPDSESFNAIAEILARYRLKLQVCKEDQFKAAGWQVTSFIKTEYLLACDFVDTADYDDEEGFVKVDNPETTEYRGVRRYWKRLVPAPENEKNEGQVIAGKSTRKSKAAEQAKDWRVPFGERVKTEVQILIDDGLLSRQDISVGVASKMKSRAKIGTETSRDLQYRAGIISLERSKSEHWSALEMVVASLFNSNQKILGNNSKDQAEALKMIQEEIDRRLDELDAAGQEDQ